MQLAFDELKAATHKLSGQRAIVLGLGYSFDKFCFIELTTLGVYLIFEFKISLNYRNKELLGVLLHLLCVRYVSALLLRVCVFYCVCVLCRQRGREG